MEDQKCKWKSEYDPSYKCHEDPLPNDSDGYCILHSTKNDKDAQQFKEKVRERITKGRLTDSGWETGKIDLQGCCFPENFNGDFRKFKIFNKMTDFGGAKLFGEVDFSGIIFSEDANFHFAHFFQKASFKRTKFYKKADFFGVIFRQGVDFEEAEFFEVCFDFVEFGDVKFSKAEFKHRGSFRPVLFGTEEEGKVAFGSGSFKYTRFTGEVIFEDIDLSQCSFLWSNISNVDFRNCKFGKKNEWLLGIIPHYRQNVLQDERYYDETKKDLLAARTYYERVRQLYLELKRNFEDKKDWNTAGDFHYGEMECRRKMKGWLGRNIFSLEALYYWASGYGERPRRAFVVWLTLMLIAFPLAYMIFEHDPFAACLWDSVRIASFMRIGEPIEPDTGWGRFFLALEFFLVPTQFALFALALRRKVKR